MLNSLYIKNIALISELTINFNDGLNVFSGETGAGKSIIIDSLNFMLGAKTDKTLIRHGEDVASVEGVFTIDDDRQDIKKTLADMNLPEDDTFIISRSMSIQGKNEIRLNGKIVALSMLREISKKLVDVHGQSEHFMLSNVSSHLELLDKFGGEELKKLKEVFAKAYDDLMSLKKELASFGGSPEERQHLIDLYSFQIQEIEEAELYEGEEDELKERFKIVTNVEKIATYLSGAIEALSSDEGAMTNVGIAYDNLGYISDLNEKFKDLRDRLKSVKFELSDIESTLSDESDSLSFDEKEADKIAERLDKIKNLKRKYGKDIAEILNYLEKTTAECDKLSRCETEIERIDGEMKRVNSDVSQKGEKLTNARKQKAKLFEKTIITELQELGMENSTFEVAFADGDYESLLTRNGLDSVEFMFSANLGEPLKPLIKVISGGEMSRFMLGLKSISSDLDNIDTMIFDEIDTGISGKIAHVVAEKFIKISRHHQVIVITHLPQIAATGDTNFLISKGVTNGHTLTSIKELSESDKVVEIARLSGGRELTDAIMAHSKELIEMYHNKK
ncbi:MAG: DNA repair protein RecN [Clostridia bacterium]